MASKRKPLHSSPGHMNFRPNATDTLKNEARGTRPTATPTTIKEVLTKMILHICKKAIFFDTNLKVALYLGSLFLISVIGDFVPFPKSYFSRSDNLFNVYFVKMGWAWTLIFSIPFLFMTSYTICCGNIRKMLTNHLPRIAIATMFWLVWTKLFNVIESGYGKCNVKSFDTKSGCLKAGHFWNGFDISGHAFILIYSSLILIEEARPIINWDNIKEHLRNEKYNRQMAETSSASNPLKNLKDEEIQVLQYLYDKYTPAIRLLFVGMTVLQVLWDIMLVCTMLYFHRMVEKVLSGIFAILTWYFTYRFWYPSSTILPDAAGKGVFQYQKDIKIDAIPLRRRNSLLINPNTRQPIPKFMGMPLYAAANASSQNSSTSGSGAGGASGSDGYPTTSYGGPRY